ncbi:MAG TPA: GNAT family protein [Acidimicrobiales bacterium]|nr:GNAT family protein [Acidimicrobiales bacterium]
MHLRETQASDFDDQVRWSGLDAEWKLWDAPWAPSTPLNQSARAKWVSRHVTDRVAGSVSSRMEIDFDDRHVGSVHWSWAEGWVDNQQDWPDVGIVIAESAHWSRGIGVAALQNWIDLLFSSLGSRRLALATWSGNTRMIRVAERLGFAEEARFREARLVRGERYDALRFGLLRDEWESR